MRGGWRADCLGALTTKIGSGATPLGGETAYKDAGIALIRSLNVYDDGFRTGRLARIDPQQADKLGNVVVEAGDVLLNITGASVARCCVVPPGVLPARVNQHVAIIRPRPSAIDPQFLRYLLASPLYKRRLLRAGEDGSTRQAITKAQLVAFLIEYPLVLSEQRRIVAILDEAFAAIATAKANAEKNLQNARALFASHLETTFGRPRPGWVVRPVSELAQHSLGKMLDRAKNRGKRRPYLRNSNVRWFAFDLSDLLEMPFLPEETDRCTAVKGDVLMCEGGYPGRAAIWNGDEPVYFQKALHRVRFHEPEHSKWFVYYLYSQGASGRLKARFSGAGIQHFTGEALARFPVPAPPLRELRPAVETMDALRAAVAQLEILSRSKVEAFDALRQSILHQAFSGAL